MPDLVLVFMIGLLGSAHCVGMCGGFVLAMAHGLPRSRRFHTRQLLYLLGKTTTYAVLGLVAGGGGAVLAHSLSGAQRALSIAVGLLLLGVGLGLLGVFRRLGGRRPAWWDALVGRMAALLRRPTLRGVFGLGLLNGLLPCGLVYAALAAAAATGDAARGALTMAVFGLATIPALYALGLTGLLLRPAWRQRLNRLGAVFVIVLGLLTLVRGTPYLQALTGMTHGSPAGHEHAQPPDPAGH